MSNAEQGYTVVQGWRQNLRADGWVLNPWSTFSMECDDVVSGPVLGTYSRHDAKEGSMRRKSISPCLSEPASQ